MTPALLVTGQTLIYPEELCQESAHQSHSLLLTVAGTLLSDYFWTCKQSHFLENIKGLVSDFHYIKGKPMLQESPTKLSYLPTVNLP